ncbi:MAG: hypothetical protein QXQ57_05640 [Sulfolobales archaeon]
MNELVRCREILISEGASRVAMSRGDECIAGYIEYMGDIMAIAIYEFKDIGVLAGKISPAISSDTADICIEILYSPHGYIAYASSYEELCKSIASKMKKLIKLKIQE